MWVEKTVFKKRGEEGVEGSRKRAAESRGEIGNVNSLSE